MDATVTLNDDKGGIEIRFAEKPAREVLDRLKARGWRWSRFNKCWYARQSEAELRYAALLAGIDPLDITRFVEGLKGADAMDLAYEDACARATGTDSEGF